MTKRIVTQGLQKLNRKISRSLSLLFEQRRKRKKAKEGKVERPPKMMVKEGSTVIGKIIKLRRRVIIQHGVVMDGIPIERNK